MTTLCTPYPGRVRITAEPRRMQGCECSGVAFGEVVRLVGAGASVDEACARTGCARTCGACLPDLLQRLAALSKS